MGLGTHTTLLQPEQCPSWRQCGNIYNKDPSSLSRPPSRTYLLLTTAKQQLEALSAALQGIMHWCKQLPQIPPWAWQFCILLQHRILGIYLLERDTVYKSPKSFTIYRTSTPRRRKGYSLCSNLSSLRCGVPMYSALPTLLSCCLSSLSGAEW